MDRSQFTFYESFFLALQRIKDKEARADGYDAICDYALHGTEPDFDALPDSVAVALYLILPNLDASRRKADNGKKGGSRKQTRSKPKANAKQEQWQEQGDRSSKKESEIEKKIEKENEIEIENECYRKTSPPVGGEVERCPDTAAARVRADYLDRVNPAASPSSLEELGAFAEELGEAVCRRAIDVARDAKKATWPYIRAILRDKQARGVKSLADWEALEGRREKAPGATHAADAKAFQRDLDWMDRFLSGGSAWSPSS
ncbi:DUF6291 domain-containing protein [uncultured Mailhella sp.]|uniref:DUF6291 domain-containing protein n=1 Tax=uncultured Mailhella sp. TaxID=1981031 RepID=UPI0025D735ED|nr:DUF6291 domain-containing protein [uncultured Mailhella sp.]